MTTAKGIADKVAGKTKQVVAEVIGDGQLREEGKTQERQGGATCDEAPAVNPRGEVSS